jgi:hypothetical protein
VNERAIELYKQAGAKAYELCKERGHEVGEIDTIWVSMMAGTFSELIVRECIDHCTDIGSRLHSTNKEGSPGDGAFDCAVDLIKHFGVEE